MLVQIMVAWWKLVGKCGYLSVNAVQIFLGIFLNVAGQLTGVLHTCICISMSVGICASHLKDVT